MPWKVLATDNLGFRFITDRFITRGCVKQVDVNRMGADIQFNEDARGFWCLRGYPIECMHFEEIEPFIGCIDLDLFCSTNTFCQTCPERLEYERIHPPLAI
ncbi:MAG: hypothetical protein ACXADB_14295 [Candidatus Hermodarchaeia archaeon]